MEDQRKIIDQIKKMLKSFEDLGSKETNVDIDLTDEGQFLITLDSIDKRVRIAHAWDGATGSFRDPGTIDITLNDLQKNNSYIVVMTECTLQDFPDLLLNAKNWLRAFS